MPRKPRTRFWVMTMFEPDWFEFQDDWMRHAIWQKEECPETKRKHHQVYLRTRQPITFETMKKKFPKAHIEQCWSPEDAEKYCSKTTTRIEGPFEAGDKPSPGKPESSLQHWATELTKGTVTIDDMWKAEEYHLLHQYKKILYEAASRAPIKDISDIKELKDWQADIIKIVEQPADKRSIYWIYDEQGGKGKTELTKYIMSRYKTCVLRDCERAMDGAYIYNGEPIVIFDMPRSSEKFNPSLMEQIKDGMVLSTKYESKMKIFPGNRHVFVFANCEPGMYFSKDRIKLIRI